MPNGYDRDWVRFCMAVTGFRAKHGRWPTAMRLDPGYIEEFRTSLLGSEELAKLQQKVRLIAEPDAGFVAQDDDGREYHYGAEELHWKLDKIDAANWLGIRLLPGHW
jgi:hypothetical protein